MQNYRMLIQYNGTKFSGWQKQGNTDNTIQGKIENVLSRMVEEEVEIIGAGRTDAGVHAKGQVASFVLPIPMDTVEIHNYLCRYLPKSIAVLRVDKVKSGFHARFNAILKTYEYRIWNSVIPNVFEEPFMYTCTDEINVDKMRKALVYLIGEQDFRAFCTRISKNKSSVRTIQGISIEKIGDEIRFTYSANGFLYNMIRIMTGTLLEVGVGRLKPEDVKDILLSKDRKKAGLTLPGKGLTLLNIKY